MIFRCLIVLTLLLSVAAQAEKNLDKTSTSGKKGDGGAPGTDYEGTTASGAGNPGENGGDAGKASPGEHAGDIESDLEDVGTKTAEVAIKTKRTAPAVDKDRRLPQPVIQKRLPVGREGYLILEAIGGEGGRGGDGGGGQNGAQGYRGEDATKYSDGTNGGPGGPGGDGGSATSGLRAGDGGNVTVGVNAKDTHLLMLIKAFQSGGEGGDAGRNGPRGSGGPGGKGGDSLKWETLETKTDEKGIEYEKVTEHERGGGKTGTPGRDGSPGSALVKSGADGSPGKFKIIVKSANGTEEFTERYDLRLKSWKIRDGNGDGIFEPNEGVEIYDVVVENVAKKNGGMATPPNYAIRLAVETNGWVIDLGQTLTIRESIPPGSSHSLKNQVLRADLKSWQATGPQDRLKENQRLSPQATLERVERKFERFEKDQTIEVTQPLKLHAIEGLDSLAPGEGTKLLMRVTNVSDKPYGFTAESKRRITLQSRYGGGDLDPNSVQYRQVTHPEGDSPLKSGSMQQKHLHEVTTLSPGESVLIEAEIQTDPNSPAYQMIDLDTDLLFTDPKDPNRQNNIRIRRFPIRIAEVYQKRKNSRILIVTNTKTEHEEVKEWKTIFDRMGLVYDIWDLSLNNGVLDLARDLPAGGSLMEHYKNGLVVVLNNAFPAEGAGEANPKEMRASSVLDPKQVLRALAANGTHLYLVGGDKQANETFLADSLIPRTGDDLTEFKSPKDFEKYARTYLNRARNADRPDIDVQTLDEESRTHDLSRFEMPIEVTKLWGVPSQKDVDAAALALQKRLETIHPDLRFVVNAQPNLPAKDEKGKWWHRWNIGKLSVQQTVDASHASAVANGVTDKELHTSGWARGEDNHVGLFLSLTFDQKLKLLHSILEREVAIVDKKIWDNTVIDEPRISNEMAEALIDSIVINLAEEQKALRKSRWNLSLSKQEVREKMRLLEQLSKFEFPDLVRGDDPNEKNDGGELVVKLVARAKFVLASQSRWYDEILRFFGKSDPRMTEAGEKYIAALQDNAFGSVPRSVPVGTQRAVERSKIARKQVESQVKELYKQSAEAAKSLNIGHKEAALRQSTNPASRPKSLVLDTELGGAEERITTPDRIAEITRRDDRLAKSKFELEKARTATRSRLRIPCRDPFNQMAYDQQLKVAGERSRQSPETETTRLRE